MARMLLAVRKNKLANAHKYVYIKEDRSCEIGLYIRMMLKYIYKTIFKVYIELAYERKLVGKTREKEVWL